jgi:hypothetical protein
MLKRIRRMFPTSQIHIEKVRDIFDRYDADKDGAIGLNELAEMFQKLSNRLTALPAVGRAHQLHCNVTCGVHSADLWIYSAFRPPKSQNNRVNTSERS